MAVINLQNLRIPANMVKHIYPRHRTLNISELSSGSGQSIPAGEEVELNIPANSYILMAAFLPESNGTLKIGSTTDGDEYLPQINISSGVAVTKNFLEYTFTAKTIYINASVNCSAKFIIL